MDQKPKGNGCLIAIVIFAIFGIISSFGSCDANSSRSNNMSREYNTNSEYRKNVDEVADVYGKTPEEVDRAINAVADAMK